MSLPLRHGNSLLFHAFTFAGQAYKACLVGLCSRNYLEFRDSLIAQTHTAIGWSSCVMRVPYIAACTEHIILSQKPCVSKLCIDHKPRCGLQARLKAVQWRKSFIPICGLNGLICNCYRLHYQGSDVPAAAHLKPGVLPARVCNIGFAEGQCGNNQLMQACSNLSSRGQGGAIQVSGSE